MYKKSTSDCDDIHVMLSWKFWTTKVNLKQEKKQFTSGSSRLSIHMERLVFSVVAEMRKRVKWIIISWHFFQILCYFSGHSKIQYIQMIIPLELKSATQRLTLTLGRKERSSSNSGSSFWLWEISEIKIMLTNHKLIQNWRSLIQIILICCNRV